MEKNHNSRDNFFLNIFENVSVLIGFLMPVFPRLLPILIGILFINAIAEFKFKFRFRQLLQSKIILAIIFYYGLNILSLLWSQNIDAGLFDNQVKLSLFILPLLLFSERNLSSHIEKKIRLAFILGCATSSIYMLSIALYEYFQTGVNHFTYITLSKIFHPSYISMYLLLAIVFIWDDYLKKRKHIFFFFLILCLLCLTTILLSSKINILILISLMLLYGFISLFQFKKNKNPAIITFIFIFISVFVILSNKNISGRISQSIDTLFSEKKTDRNETASTGARILIWEAGLELLKEKCLMGVGCGDVKDELVKKYEVMGFDGIARTKLNAHNQYLQTAISAGILGLALLLYIIINSIYRGFKEQNMLIILFFAIIAVNFSVESMLETQAGVIFFAFFSSILLKARNHKSNMDADHGIHIL